MAAVMVPAAVVTELLSALDRECFGRAVAERLALPRARAAYALLGPATVDAPAWVDPPSEGDGTM